MRPELRSFTNLTATGSARLRSDDEGPEVERLEMQLKHQHYHDPLTDLPNRLYFLEVLEAMAKRQPVAAAVLMIDLDDFQLINEVAGHDAGDELLIGFAERLGGCIRRTDFAARLGGDEFGVVLDGIIDVDDALAAARHIQEELRQPFSVNGEPAIQNASFGVTMLEPADTPSKIFHRAQVAVLAAKNDGKATVATFDSNLAETLRQRHDIVQDLDRAIAHRDMGVVYQPIVDLATGAIHSIESLARWTTRDGRPVPPSVFVGVAEEHGLIGPLFDHMLEVSLAESAPWFDAHPDLCMHVNLSPLQMRERGLVARISAALHKASVNPRNVGIEMTESVLALDQAVTTENLDGLAEAGLKIVLDDFGTGYSSLSYLMRFEPEMLKLDRSFVEQMASRNDPRLARSILSLATEFGIIGVAEGIETRHQLAMLQQIGWPLGQGFLWSGGLSARDLLPLLEGPVQPVAL